VKERFKDSSSKRQQSMDLKYNLSKLKDFKKVAIIPTVSLPVLNYDVLHEEN